MHRVRERVRTADGGKAPVFTSFRSRDGHAAGDA